MAYGVLIESSIQAKDNDALNRFAVSSTTAVAGILEAGLIDRHQQIIRQQWGIATIL